MNKRLSLPSFPVPQTNEMWVTNLFQNLNDYFSVLTDHLNFQLPDKQIKVSATDTTGALQAATALTLKSSIQVIRSGGSANVDIQTLYPPTNQTTATGIVFLILTHQTHNYELKNESGGTGNMKLGADLEVTSSKKDKAIGLIYDGEFWYPLPNQNDLAN